MIHDLEVSLEEGRRIQRLKNQRAIALLARMLEEGDEEEQRETFEVITKGLNANHTSDRITLLIGSSSPDPGFFCD